MKNTTRLLLIYQFLYDKSDEEHYVTIADINKYLRTKDLDGDRETISDSIKELQSMGYDIKCVRSTQNKYCLKSRKFTVAEVKMLIDAVQFSSFIPQKKSKELVSKLASLVSDNSAELMKRQLYIESRFKADNAYITDNVDLIHRAINEGRKITFQYYDYSADKKKDLKFDGWRYTLSPYVLIWNNSQYYVVGYFEKYDSISKFRVDRICNLQISEEKRIKQPAGFRVADFFEKEFSMMHGEQCQVKLLCENRLMGSIIDKFGKGVDTAIVDDDHFIANVTVSLTGAFYGWVFASEGKMKIVAPEAAVKGFEDNLKAYL